MAILTRDALDEAALRAKVEAPSCGAITSFSGVVRNHNEGRKVLRIEYEAAPPTLALLTELEKKAKEKFPVHEVLIAHRVGTLQVGEASVVIAVSSEHRGESFQACRWAIDTLKHTIPIWKKEYFEDGESDWVEGCKMHSLGENEEEHSHEPSGKSLHRHGR